MLGWFYGKSFDPEKDIPSLEGKVILVTGGNNGLGKETVLQLAKHDPRQIFLAARTQSKAEAAITEIKNAIPAARISFLPLDLASFSSIKAAAEDFASRSDRLDILINNAAVAVVPYSTTGEGYEIQFGTNHMGHALLTKLLLPTLLKTAEQPNSDVRVINVSSKGHMFAPSPGILYDQSTLEQHSPLTRYGHTKLANILHARELQRRHPSITATAIHPGVIVTSLYDTVKSGYPGMGLMLSLVNTVASYGILPELYDVPKGTHTQLWAATAEREVVRSGHYWLPVGMKNAGTKYAQSEELAGELWEWTEEEFGKHGV